MSTDQHVETLVKNYTPPQGVARPASGPMVHKKGQILFKEGSFLSVFTDMKLQKPLQVLFQRNFQRI